MDLIGRTFAGHPSRMAGAAIALAVVAALAWYLGSPLFIRTTLNEALPTGAVPAAATAPGDAARPATGGAPVQSAATAAPRSTTTIATGQLGFVDGLHNGTGKVDLLQTGTDRLLRFENVSITNAPDVHVYLSTDTGGAYVPANSVELGTLRATNGSFNYAVPADLDLARFRSVVVWCRAFSVLVTWADLVR